MNDTTAEERVRERQKFGTALLHNGFRQLWLTQLLREANFRFARDHAMPPPDTSYGAGSTGGMDDVDSFYSGKSGANPSADAGKVQKFYHGGVRPDHMDFESIKTEKALAQKPTICCPNCHNPVKELDSAQPKYKKPEGIEEEAPMHYVLHPCACKVHPEWAAAFTKEINRRIEGEVPLPVCDFKPEELDAKVRALEEQITDILAKRDMAEGAAHTRLEYYLVIAVDELMRLLPGDHNHLPQVDALEPEVEKWAAQNHMKQPPVKKSSEFGYPKGFNNPLQKSGSTNSGVVNLCGPGTHNALQSEGSLFAKEEAMHVDPATAAAGKAKLSQQRQAAKITSLGGMLSKRTLGELFNIDISTEQEQLAKELAQQAKATPVSTLGHDKPALYPGLSSVATNSTLVVTAVRTWDKSLLAASREFMDRHNLLTLQLINEQILQQPYYDTRAASSWLVTIKRSIDSHLQHGTAICPEARQLLAVVIPVLVPAAGLVPTKTGLSTGLPQPVSEEEALEDFHAKFAPAKRRIVKRQGESGDGPA